MLGGRYSEALAAFAVSRLVLIVALVPGSRAWDRFPWAWDAGFYHEIAAYGYVGIPTPNIELVAPAFFPLLPALERVGQTFWGSYEAWGVIIGNVTTLAALIVLQRVTAQRFGAGVGALAVWAVALFPFSYVLSTGYTEGPFLLASLVAYDATLRRREVLGAVAGFAAGLLRPTGVLLVPALAWDAWRHPERRRAALAAAAGTAAGPLVFFLYLRWKRDDFLASLHAQQHGWQRSVSLADAPGDLWTYVAQAVTWPRGTYLVYLAAVPLCLLGLWLLWRAGVRDGPFVFALLGLLAPLSTGSAMSLPRFAMATFPYAWAAGIGLAALDEQRRRVLLAISAVALVACVYASYWASGKLAP